MNQMLISSATKVSDLYLYDGACVDCGEEWRSVSGGPYYVRDRNGRQRLAGVGDVIETPEQLHCKCRGSIEKAARDGSANQN